MQFVHKGVGDWVMGERNVGKGFGEINNHVN
jgi:hypothetical protein